MLRIISWNIRSRNPKLKKLIDHIFSYNPDIVFLQEVPHNLLQSLKMKYKNIAYTCDFHSTAKSRCVYTVTISKEKIVEIKEITYSTEKPSSILHNIVYEKINKINELHNAVAIKTTYLYNNKVVNFVNTRLSCATRPKNRIEYFENIMAKLESGEANIVAGDLNIVNRPIFNWYTGWTRGYKLSDYKISEEKIFQKIFEKYNLASPFEGMRTMIWCLPKLQLDYILIPKEMNYSKKSVGKTLGSDHRMLLLDLEI